MAIPVSHIVYKQIHTDSAQSRLHIYTTTQMQLTVNKYKLEMQLNNMASVTLGSIIYLPKY